MWFVDAVAAEGQSLLTKPFVGGPESGPAMMDKLRIRRGFPRKTVSSHQLRHVLSQIEFSRHSLARRLAHRCTQFRIAQQLENSRAGSFGVPAIDQIARNAISDQFRDPADAGR